VRRVPSSDIAMAVVGVIVPDDSRFHGPAFNRAAQMFQRELLLSLARTGLRPTAVYSVEPVPAFPRSGRLLGRRGMTTLPGGLLIRLLPFVNVALLKPLTAGLATMVALLAWGWRHRDRRRLVHCINLSMPPGLFILLAARLIRAKATVSLLDVNQPGALVPDVVARRIDFWLHRRLIPRFDGHMVASEAIAQDFAPGRRVCRIEGGIRPEDFADGVSDRGASTRNPGKRFRAVLAGSLEPYNGVVLALEAFNLLPVDGFELVIAGTGSLASLVELRASDDSRLTYAGFLEFREVLELYRSADLLLNIRLTKMLRTQHFFPSKLMELMASGIPVISTCTGHVVEEFDGLVYLLHDETPEALARLIRNVARLSREERTLVGRRARAHMFAHKTWDKQAEKLAQYLSREVFGNAA
jgi:glycosyltransferase involved in cell wall biosynthesis